MKDESKRVYSVGMYEGIVHPLLAAGRKRLGMGRLLCAWCGKLLNANIKPSLSLDSHGICPECRDKYFPAGDE